MFYQLFKKCHNREVSNRLAQEFKSVSRKARKQALDTLVKLDDADSSSWKLYHTATIENYGAKTTEFAVTKAVPQFSVLLSPSLSFCPILSLIR